MQMLISWVNEIFYALSDPPYVRTNKLLQGMKMHKSLMKIWLDESSFLLYVQTVQ